MKVMVIGSADSVHIKGYIKNVLLDSGFKVAILSPEISDDSRAFYKSNHVVVLPYFHPSNTGLFRNRHLRVFRRYINGLIAKLYKPDIVHALYLHAVYCHLVGMFGSRCKKILTYMGSDLLRADEKLLEHQRGVFSEVDHITMATQEMYEKFTSAFGTEFLPKVRFLKFGGEIFEQIKKLSTEMSKSECKQWLGISKEKIVIAVGSNGSEAQQHFKILGSINKMPVTYKKKICLLLQMTYGAPPEYIASVKEYLKTMECEWILKEHLLPSEDVAKVRIATDIFVFAQITDAFSGVMQEHLYLNRIAIKGAWLNYSALDQLGSKCYDFQDFTEIAELLQSIINKDPNLGMDQPVVLEEKIYQMSAWEAVKNNWLELYASEK